MSTSTLDRTHIKLVEAPAMRQWAEAFIRAKQAENVRPNTIRFYKEKFKRFLEWCDARQVTAPQEMTPDTLRQFLLWLEEAGHNPGGRAGFYKVIRAFVRWWAEEDEPPGWRDPFKRVKIPKVSDEPLDPADTDTVRALLGITWKRTDKRNQAIIRTLFDTGVRAMELCNLKLDHYNPITGDLLILAGKGNKNRTVFVGKNTRRTMRQWLKARGAAPGALFLSESGGHLSYNGLREVVQIAARRAGVKPPPLHAFRRAFAVNCLRAGMDLLTLQKLMGHSDLATLKRYVKLLKDDLQTAHALASPVDRMGL